jgi:hypothetical protein
MSRATGARWRVLVLLVFASFISHVLRSVMSIAGPAIVEDFELTEQLLGNILAALPIEARRYCPPVTVEG